MATNNFTYETRFTAVNTMSLAVNQATQDVESLRVTVGNLGQQAEDTRKSFVGLNSEITTGLLPSARRGSKEVQNLNGNFMAMRGALFGVQMSLFYVSMLTSNLMAMETASNSVETAQERLNQVVREGGRGTLEYRNAVRQLETAQINFQRQQIMSTVMTVAMGFQLVSLGMSFQQVIPQITTATTALRAWVTTMTFAKALTIVGAASLIAGVGVAAYSINQMNQAQTNSGNSNNINVEVTVDSPYDSYMRQNRKAAINAGVA